MALPGKNLPTEATPKGGRVMMLDIGTVKPDPNQPRPDFEFSGPEMAELAASIKKHGVLQPITVEPGDGPAQFRIIMGERRLRAAKIAGLTQIPALLGKVLPPDQREIQQIHENLQRKGFSTEALVAAVEKLLATGMKQSDIAEAFNIRKELVSRYVTLAKAPAYLRELAKSVTTRALYNLTRLDERYPEAVAQFISTTKPEDIDQGTVGAFAASLDRPAEPTSPVVLAQPSLPPDVVGADDAAEIEERGARDGASEGLEEPDSHSGSEPGNRDVPMPSLGNGSAGGPKRPTSADEKPISSRKATAGFKLFFQVGKDELELDLAATALRQDGECVLIDALGQPVIVPLKSVQLVEVRSV